MANMYGVSSGIELSFEEFCKQGVTVSTEVIELPKQENSVVEESYTPTSSFSCIPKITDILGVFKSGIGLDISKNHTGIALWKDRVLTTEGFAVNSSYDKDSYLAEARMRHEFKDKLKSLLAGYDWEVCIIEDVYGGTNFDTTRKLLALNCVVDELVLEKQVSIDYIYRFKEAEWIKDLRKIIKFGNRLNPKYECQRILEHLSFDFVMEHKDDKKSKKLEIFYEDICDATGQLLSLAMRLNFNDREIKSSSVKLKDIKMVFIEEPEDLFMLDDDILARNQIVPVEITSKDIEQEILSLAEKRPDAVMSAYVENATLGVFGIKNGFDYYEQGYGYLVFYNKRTCKRR